MTLVWPFRPRNDIVESLEWLTDVHTCKRAEYRRCVRPLPRVGYACRYQLDAADYGIARELARTAGGAPILVPDWPNAAQIPDIAAGTVSLPVDASAVPAYKGGRSALVWCGDHNYEVVTVTAVNTGTIATSATASAYVRPSIVPLRLGAFDDKFQGTRGAHRYTEASASFICTDTEDLFLTGTGIGYPTYLGSPVVIDPPELINDVQDQQTRDVEVVDSKTGALYNYPTCSIAKQTSALGWTALNADELWSIRTWLHACRGRWKHFWVPSWNNDMLVTADLNPGDDTVQIAAVGFATKYQLPVDIVLITVFGASLCLRIIDVTAGPAGSELLHFSGAISGHTWEASSIDRACKLTLSRFDTDKLEIQHLPGRQATVAASIKEVPIYP